MEEKVVAVDKYRVPAIERADTILKEIAENPNTLRLIDLSKKLGINKSSLYSLLHTMEKLDWITKGNNDCYSLGPSLGTISAAYFKQFNILDSFYAESVSSLKKINEHMQIGVLQGDSVVYIGKVRGDSRVQLVTEPGTRFPAYSTSIGKIQLSHFSKEELRELYPNEPLEPKTPYTITSIEKLYENVSEARHNGYIEEHQESAEGFHCVAAPIMNYENKIIAGISFAMTTSSWEHKGDEAREEIMALAKRLSMYAGYRA